MERDLAASQAASPSWAELQSLSADHGDGFWLLDLDRLRSNLSRFRKAFLASGWDNTRLAWSFKTSWIPAVVQAAREAGSLSEVVSRHEYELAERLGIPPAEIVFNGPLKTASDLDHACGGGSLVHLDGPDEVADLLTLAKGARARHFRVGLRANIDIGQSERGRFGLDAEAGDLQRACRELLAEPNITVGGLHVHISAARTPDAFARRARRLSSLAKEIWPSGPGPEYIDLGGGFAGPMPDSLAAQIGAPMPSWESCALAVTSELRRHWPKGGPQLILEPGLALAADTMRFAARIGSIKVIAGTRYAIAGASVYSVKPTLHRFDMPFTIARGPGSIEELRPTVVSGWTCMESDILSRGNRQAVHRGDWLVFENCGAYTFVLSPRFIRGTPAVLASDGDVGWRTIRRADSPRSWLQPFDEMK